MEKRILIAPLNWGLGHASRCIPIIRELKRKGFTPIIASDGEALQLLQYEFPELEKVTLPSYNITYPGENKNFKIKMLRNLPNIAKAVNTEEKETDRLIKQFSINGIISDNRFGVRSKKVPSVIITHQVTLLTGKTTWLSSKLNQRFLNKFDECWVPDAKYVPNLSGVMGHPKHTGLNLKYIGPLTAMTKQNLPVKYNIMVLLSGPEPQRTLLEKKLLLELKDLKTKVLMVCGKVEKTQQITRSGPIKIYNYMTTAQLETAINESNLIICRSGYSTIMDLQALEKKAFFIPTPGQYEQEYLAKQLKKQKQVPSCPQSKFSCTALQNISHYSGLKQLTEKNNFEELFGLFHGE